MDSALYEPVIGLEVHAELLTESKMFCGCAVVDLLDAEPNSSVCEICTAMPGTLPAINQRAVEYALRVALALNCAVPERSLFARKNYFYPDLPKGFQISQYELPLAVDGVLPIEVDGEQQDVRIRRVHLEEDTGKLFHQAGSSRVDFNRAGVPLLEIVTEPVLRSPHAALVFATELRTLLRYLGVNSGDMERGVIRFEANISVREAGSDHLPTRVEIKNLNSFRSMTRALEHEYERQVAVLSAGGQIQQQTLGWDETRSTTVPQRSKEQADDYRYFPEPDLPPLVIDRIWLEEIRKSLPELPSARRARLAEQYGLDAPLAALLVEDRRIGDFFEQAARAAKNLPPVTLANWLTGEVFALLNERGIALQHSKLTPVHLAELVQLVEEGSINALTAKTVLEHSFATGARPADVVKQQGLSQESDPSRIRAIVEQVLRENPEQLSLYLGGKETLSQWFFGQVMKATSGRADPQIVRQELDEALAAQD